MLFPLLLHNLLRRRSARSWTAPVSGAADRLHAVLWDLFRRKRQRHEAFSRTRKPSAAAVTSQQDALGTACYCRSRLTVFSENGKLRTVAATTRSLAPRPRLSFSAFVFRSMRCNNYHTAMPREGKSWTTGLEVGGGGGGGGSEGLLLGYLSVSVFVCVVLCVFSATALPAQLPSVCAVNNAVPAHINISGAACVFLGFHVRMCHTSSGCVARVCRHCGFSSHTNHGRKWAHYEMTMSVQ